MKRTLSSLDVRAIVGELQWTVGGIVDKAYQPDHETVVLRLRKPGKQEQDPKAGRFDLLLRASAWFCATTRETEMPTEPTAFAMNLRKNLGGGTVAGLRQLGFDRIVELHVLRGKDTLRLVLEMIPEGNVVLVGPGGGGASSGPSGGRGLHGGGSGAIVQSLTMTSGKRVIRPKVEYAPPPPRPDPTGMDYESFALAVRSGARDVVRAVAAVGLGGPLAEELLTRARLDKHTPVEALRDTDLHAIYDAWRLLNDRLARHDMEPALLYVEGVPEDVAPFPMASWEGVPRSEVVRVAEFSEALDRYWHELPSDAPRQPVAGEHRLEKLRRQLEHQRAAIAKHEEDIEAQQAAAEALYLNYAQVEEALRKAAQGEPHEIVASAKDDGSVVARLRTATGAELTAPLDPKLDVQQNARALYERAKRAKGKLDGARVAIADTQASLRVAEKEVAAEKARVAEEAAKPRATRERRFWFENFRWFYASSGHLVVGGRDAPSNEKVVKKYLADGDRYCHADVHGAPSVVVKHTDAGVPEEALAEATLFAASLSKAWSHTTVADAYWVTPEQVSKSPQPGEYVARGAFIIRGERNWARNLKLEHAVGVVHLSPQGAPVEPAAVKEGGPRGPVMKVMGGPPAALRKWSAKFVVVEPGEVSKTAVAKRLAKEWGVGEAEVERALPPGPVRLVTG